MTLPIVSLSDINLLVFSTASPSLEALEDFMDIKTGLKTEALYKEHGREPFIPLLTRMNQLSQEIGPIGMHTSELVEYDH